jgi:hypothetical protein
MFDIPANSTTMIGSMPQKETPRALEALACHPLSIPAWPQLPARSFREGMLVQYTECLPGIVTDVAQRKVTLNRNAGLITAISDFYSKTLEDDLTPFAVTEKYADGLMGFIAALRQSGERLPILKGQVVGPFTLGLGVNDGENRAIWFDEQYRDVVLKGLAKTAAWQANILGTMAEKVLLFFDEPILSALGTPAYMGISDEHVLAGLNEVTEAVHNTGAAVGVHCCGNMDWGLLARSDIDIIAFDAFGFGDKVALYPSEIGNFLKKGGYLAWGIVPTDDSQSIANSSGDSLRAKRDELMSIFTAKGLPSDQLEKQRLYTPACGMGNLKPEESVQVLRLLSEVGE